MWQLGRFSSHLCCRAFLTEIVYSVQFGKLFIHRSKGHEILICSSCLLPLITLRLIVRFLMSKALSKSSFVTYPFEAFLDVLQGFVQSSPCRNHPVLHCSTRVACLVLQLAKIEPCVHITSHSPKLIVMLRLLHVPLNTFPVAITYRIVLWHTKAYLHE